MVLQISITLLLKLDHENTLPTLKTDEFPRVQRVNLSEEIQWFTAFVRFKDNSSDI
jgi:hypothetical protein